MHINIYQTKFVYTYKRQACKYSARVQRAFNTNLVAPAAIVQSQCRNCPRHSCVHRPLHTQLQLSPQKLSFLMLIIVCRRLSGFPRTLQKTFSTLSLDPAPFPFQAAASTKIPYGTAHRLCCSASFFAECCLQLRVSSLSISRMTSGSSRSSWRRSGMSLAGNLE